MATERLAEFDALIGRYYGSSDVLADPRKRVEDLFSSYYGHPAVPSRRNEPAPAVSLSLGCDDGEVLSQPSASTPVEASANGEASALDFEEYVIEIAGPSAAPSPDNPGEPLPTRAAQRENPPPPAEPVSPPPVTAPARPPQAAAPAETWTAAALVDRAPAAESGSPAPGPAAPTPASASLSIDEADIMSEIQSIIRAGKNYSNQASEPDHAPSPARNGAAGSPYAGTSGQPGEGHAIFERIAQSMQLANAYDLGTVELENRFAAFDQQEDHVRRVANGSPAPAAMSAPARAAPIATADFLADLDAITTPPPQPVSRPFYDTGEHVVAGNGLYAERLRVGKGLTVSFSYGQIIAMADLYEKVDDLMSADPGELNRLKNLIVRNTAYYEGKRANKDLNVSNKEWDDATMGRYIKLAAGNYEHFSPSNVAMGSGVATIHGNNRAHWEMHHRLAIEDAQKQYLRSGSHASLFFEQALIINAFGDHFLTDAFAAGHLINKEAMVARFKSAFFSGADLSGSGAQFFDRVADKAWVGDVAAQFSKLETYDHPKIWGILPLPWHPNIDSASRFATVLKEAARQQPDRVGNLVVEALHNYLNEHGIEVTNDAGDGTWVLPGDGTLTIGTGLLTPANLAKNLTIMRRAVQQSIDHINSPSIQVSNLQFQPLFDAVWRNVPRLTPASQGHMTALIADYTNPGSSTLTTAAAKIVTEQLEMFIKLLIDEKKLRPA